MQWLVRVLVVINTASFLLGSLWFFRRPKPINIQLKLFAAWLVVATGGYVIWVMRSQTHWLRTNLGFILLLLSGVLFWWTLLAFPEKGHLLAIFYYNPSDQIWTSGPYRWIRHPFYMSYILTWLAGPSVISNSWMTLISGIMVAIYYIAAKQEEKQFLNSPSISTAYESYRQHVGMFFPKILCKSKP